MSAFEEIFNDILVESTNLKNYGLTKQQIDYLEKMVLFEIERSMREIIFQGEEYLKANRIDNDKYRNIIENILENWKILIKNSYYDFKTNKVKI